MSDDIMEENTALWVRNANQAATIARLRDESDAQFRRIAELEAELADALPAVRAEQRKTARAEARLAELEAEVKIHKAGAESELARSHRYEARLAAVIALCDAAEAEDYEAVRVNAVRAAATGGQQ